MKRKMTKRTAAWLTAAGVLAAVVLPVYGEEAVSEQAAPRTVITDIYHQHIGNSVDGGGCYQEEIAHVHDGNEQEGGACFREPVYHSHEGSKEDGSGCYSQPVYHVHEGDEQQGGGCYGEIYHSHTEECYESAICTIRYTKGEVLGTFTSECHDHSLTTYERASGTALHSDCGLGEESVNLEYCQTCGMYQQNYHGFQKLICGWEEGDISGYELTCTLSETDIDEYEAGCGKDETYVDSYLCTCMEEIDGYSRNCGMEEDVPCGRLIVTNETSGTGEKVNVSVRIEDLTGGKLILSEDPFVWYDENRKEIGRGQRITVEENGDYAVKVRLENKDVNEEGLSSKITVDNILAQTQERTPAPTQGTPTPTQSTPTPAQGKATPDNSPEPERETDETPFPSAEPEKEPEKSPVPTPLPTIKPTEMPEETEQNEYVNDEEEGANNQENEARSRVNRDGVVNNSAPVPTSDRKASGIMKKETEESKLPELAAVNPVTVKQETAVQEGGIFANPVVRVVSITLGTFLLLAGILLLLWYLRRSVRIYNDDGEGNLIFIGRCPVRLEEEGYAITISEKMIERAYTNRYCIRPDLFLIGKKEDQELLVYGENQRISVYLAKEMIVLFG